MNRRSAIRNVVLVTAGVAFLPSCMQQEAAPAIKLKNFTITGDEENMLAGLAETIIPATTAPGAADVGAHRFALIMVDDCASKANREKFVAGLKGFEDLVRKRFSSSFSKLSSTQKAGLLKDLEAKKDIPEDVTAFYSAMKQLTIQSFTSSKYYLTEVRKYELVPGRYHGCVPVTSTAVTPDD